MTLWVKGQRGVAAPRRECSATLWGTDPGPVQSENEYSNRNEVDGLPHLVEKVELGEDAHNDCREEQPSRDAVELLLGRPNAEASDRGDRERSNEAADGDVDQRRLVAPAWRDEPEVDHDVAHDEREVRQEA